MCTMQSDNGEIAKPMAKPTATQLDDGKMMQSHYYKAKLTTIHSYNMSYKKPGSQAASSSSSGAAAKSSGTDAGLKSPLTLGAVAK